MHSNFGFLPQNAMLVDTDLDMAGYRGERVSQMQQRLLDTLKTIPGATAVGLTDQIPLGEGWGSSNVFKDSTTDLKTSNAAADAMRFGVSPDYFRAAGTSLLAGRVFTIHDDQSAPRVAVINPEFARMLFDSTTNILGRYFKLIDGTRIQVVGIVEDGKYKTLAEATEASDVFADSAVAQQCDMVGGALKRQSTADGSGNGQQIART